VSDTAYTPDELLNWLCWERALTGELFYPPDESAQECLEAVEGVTDYRRGWEEGYHARSYSEAVQFYRDLEARGHDPVDRANRGIEQARARGLDLDPIDWTWLESAEDDTIDEVNRDDHDVVIEEETRESFDEMLDELDLTEADFSERLVNSIGDATPFLEPPIETDDIEQLENEELRKLAWNLHALASGYNYTSDVVTPDILRDPPGTWVGPDVERRVKAACQVIREVYVELLEEFNEQVADDD
jgi:hypothetical protein